MATVNEIRQRAKLQDLSERTMARNVISGNMPFGKYAGDKIIATVKNHPHYCGGLIRRLKCDCYSSKALKAIIITLIGKEFP